MNVEMAGGASTCANARCLDQLATVGESVGNQRACTALVGLLRGIEHGQCRMPPEPRGGELGLDGQHGVGKVASGRVELAAICTPAIQADSGQVGLTERMDKIM